MTKWIVQIEEQAPKDVHGIGSDDSRVADLVAALKQWDGEVVTAADSWRIKLTIDAAVPEDAISQGRIIAERTVAECRLAVWQIVSLQAIEVDTFHAQLETLSYSNLLGTTEVCDLLEVTRQRLHQLRRERGFPEPTVEVSATPLWVKATVDSFIAGWPRKPGRPRLEPLPESGGVWPGDQVHR